MAKHLEVEVVLVQGAFEDIRELEVALELFAVADAGLLPVFHCVKRADLAHNFASLGPWDVYQAHAIVDVIVDLLAHPKKGIGVK